MWHDVFEPILVSVACGLFGLGFGIAGFLIKRMLSDYMAKAKKLGAIRDKRLDDLEAWRARVTEGSTGKQVNGSPGGEIDDPTPSSHSKLRSRKTQSE